MQIKSSQIFSQAALVELLCQFLFAYRICDHLSSVQGICYRKFKIISSNKRFCFPFSNNLIELNLMKFDQIELSQNTCISKNAFDLYVYNADQTIWIFV